MNISSLARLLSVSKLTASTLVGKVGMSEQGARLLLDYAKCPLGEDLNYLLKKTKLSEPEFRLRTGCLTYQAQRTYLVNTNCESPSCELSTCEPEFLTEFGKLYHADCLDVLRTVPDNYFDVIFADPPFNLKKLYPSKINDSLPEEQYVLWSERWLLECARTLKFGGSLFVWNLPKWAIIYSDILAKHLVFKHWIAVEMKSCLPIPGRLYPAHYALLYFTKGKQVTFTPDRIPAQICQNCYKELHDYGGYKSKMNELGVNISDIWTDISPVRHSRYKNREANELPLKLLDRIITMSTKQGEIIFDPFGGSGTTYIVAELLHRRWIGCEIGPITDIVDRFSKLDADAEVLEKIKRNKNHLFTEDTIKERKKRNLWTPDDFKPKEVQSNPKKYGLWGML